MFVNFFEESKLTANFSVIKMEKSDKYHDIFEQRDNLFAFFMKQLKMHSLIILGKIHLRRAPVSVQSLLEAIEGIKLFCMISMASRAQPEAVIYQATSICPLLLRTKSTKQTLPFTYE